MSRNGIFTMKVKGALTMMAFTDRLGSDENQDEIGYAPAGAVERHEVKSRMSPYQIKVEWDEEGQVWIAFSDDVPGLATGADTFEALVEKLRFVVPELLEENGLIEAGGEEVPFIITAERAEIGIHKAL